MQSIQGLKELLTEKIIATKKELAGLEKALEALGGEKRGEKAKPAKSKPPAEAATVTREAVLEACSGELCSAEKVALKLGADTGRVSQVLSALYAAGKLEREGQRGGYEYRKKEESASPFAKGGES